MVKYILLIMFMITFSYSDIFLKDNNTMSIRSDNNKVIIFVNNDNVISIMLRDVPKTPFIFIYYKDRPITVRTINGYQYKNYYIFKTDLKITQITGKFCTELFVILNQSDSGIYDTIDITNLDKYYKSFQKNYAKN